MTRIIGGVAGGRPLATPRGRSTRPTSDRVREALFSILAARDLLAGAAVLDLYAGSGALGLEAASRGAAQVTLVEEDRAAARLIASNAAALGLQAHVVTASVRTFAGRVRGTAYGLVLADPPYPMTEARLGADLAALVAGGVFAPDALLVVERSARSPGPAWPPGLHLSAERRYGETTLWFARAGAADLLGSAQPGDDTDVGAPGSAEEE